MGEGGEDRKRETKAVQGQVGDPRKRHTDSFSKGIGRGPFHNLVKTCCLLCVSMFLALTLALHAISLAKQLHYDIKIQYAS